MIELTHDAVDRSPSAADKKVKEAQFAIDKILERQDEDFRDQHRTFKEAAALMADATAAADRNVAEKVK